MSLLNDYLTNLKVLVATQQTVRDLSAQLRVALKNQVDSIAVTAYISIVCVAILLIIFVVLDKKLFMSSLKSE